ncbi:MAG: 3-oxoacyl-ACP reductase family protein [Candidatus Omnitrophota bacterium]
MNHNLNGKVAIVTGASRGIGRDIVIKLASLGCNIAFNYLTSESEAQTLYDLVEEKGVRCHKKSVNIADYGAVKTWIDEIKQEFGEFHILVNNAGVIDDKALMMMAPEQWHKVIDTNLNGMFNVCRHCIVSFMKQKQGDIINISSISGVIGLVGQTNYSASKGGMNAFTKALAKEVARFNVKVNAIAPGFIQTEILSKFTEEQMVQFKQEIPLGRIGTPEDVSNCVAFLLSEAAGYITGQVIVVDGGLAMR